MNNENFNFGEIVISKENAPQKGSKSSIAKVVEISESLKSYSKEEIATIKNSKHSTVGAKDNPEARSTFLVNISGNSENGYSTEIHFNNDPEKIYTVEFTAEQYSRNFKVLIPNTVKDQIRINTIINHAVKDPSTWLSLISPIAKEFGISR